MTLPPVQPSLDEIRKCINTRDIDGLIRSTPALIATYTHSDWIAIASDLLMLYNPKFERIRPLLQPGFADIVLSQLIRELATQKKSLLLFGSSYPFVPLSYHYYTSSTTWFFDAVNAVSHPVAWITGFASCIFSVIDALAYSRWEDEDPRIPLAKMILAGDLDSSYWSIDTETPRSFLDRAPSLAIFMDAARRMAWELIISRLDVLERHTIYDYDFARIAAEWMENQLAPLPPRANL